MKRLSLALVVLLLSLTFVPTTARAYFATLDTGDVLNKGQFQAMFSPQIIFNNYDGGNFTGRLDMGISDSLSARGILGFGKVDFQIGGMMKWIPFPDTESQPAIGGEAGVLIARIGGLTQYSLRIHPLISKRIETEIGDVIPYGSVPFGVTVQTGGKEETFLPAQLVVGSELRPLEMKNWSFFGEMGINLAHTFGYVNIAVAYRFDDASFKK